MEYLKKIYARRPSTWTSATGRRYRLGRSVLAYKELGVMA